MKMNSDKGSPAWCPFSNYRSRLILEYLKLWGAGGKTWRCRKKKPQNGYELRIHTKVYNKYIM